MAELIRDDQTYEVIGACMEVHTLLGHGLLEIVYKDALEHEFQLRGIPYYREKQYSVTFKDIVLPHYFFADFVVYEDIILEIKAVNGIIDEFVKQTLNYMAIAHAPLGLIANFGAKSFQLKRLVR